MRKRAVDTSGQPALIDLAGFRFQVLDASTRSLVGDPFETNSAGRANSGELPARQALLLTEIATPFPVEQLAEVAFTIGRRRQPLEITNRMRQVGPYG